MKESTIEFYFPLVDYVGPDHAAVAAGIVNKHNLLPIRSPVWENKEKLRLGLTIASIHPQNASPDAVNVKIIFEDNQSRALELNIFATFSLLQLIPASDAEIEQFVQQL